MSELPYNQSEPAIFVINGVKTLPIYFISAITLEDLPAFGEGKVKIVYRDPEYKSVPYSLTSEWFENIGRSSDVALKMVDDWNKHRAHYAYYSQFKDDLGGEKAKAFHEHLALLSVLCDSRLTIETAPLWETFDTALRFANIHSKYRSDVARDVHYRHYEEQLASLFKDSRMASLSDRRLLDRIKLQIQSKAAIWSSLPPIHHASTEKDRRTKVRVFYSYSRKDEALRKTLEDHLAVLMRSGVIESWHDRKIGAGNEWKESIDSNIESADVILLLISSSFIGSDYCYDIEMKRAMERHQQGSARVIPIILKPCLWTNSPFGKLQALPTDAKAVTKWSNKDAAFADIAEGISQTIKHMLTTIHISL